MDWQSSDGSSVHDHGRCTRCAEKGYACHYIPATTRHIKIACEPCRKASQKCAWPRLQWHTDEDGATAKWPEAEIAWDDEGGKVDLASLAQRPCLGPVFGNIGGGKTPSITISDKLSNSQKGSGKAPSAAMYSMSQDTVKFFVGLKGTIFYAAAQHVADTSERLSDQLHREAQEILEVVQSPAGPDVPDNGDEALGLFTEHLERVYKTVVDLFGPEALDKYMLWGPKKLGKEFTPNPMVRVAQKAKAEQLGVDGIDTALELVVQEIIGLQHRYAAQLLRIVRGEQLLADAIKTAEQSAKDARAGLKEARDEVKTLTGQLAAARLSLKLVKDDLQLAKEARAKAEEARAANEEVEQLRVAIGRQDEEIRKLKAEVKKAEEGKPEPEKPAPKKDQPSPESDDEDGRL